MNTLLPPSAARRRAASDISTRQRQPSTLEPVDPEGRAALAEEFLRLHGNSGRALPSLSRGSRLWGMRYGAALAVACSRLAKRLLDVVAASAALLALLPLFLAVAALIRRSDGGSVLFWQVRVGRHGRTFWMPKFRSMRVDAERLKDALLARNDHASGVTFKMKDDPRVTPIGRFLRKFSIDELPQLWCVLLGDMTLVGPRPPVPREVAAYSLADRRRLDVKPGLTCLWQVGGRGDIPFDRQVELDVEYIRSQSLKLDLVLLAKTIPAVIQGRGAY